MNPVCRTLAVLTVELMMHMKSTSLGSDNESPDVMWPRGLREECSVELGQGQQVPPRPRRPLLDAGAPRCPK